LFIPANGYGTKTFTTFDAVSAMSPTVQNMFRYINGSNFSDKNILVKNVGSQINQI